MLSQSVPESKEKEDIETLERKKIIYVSLIDYDLCLAHKGCFDNNHFYPERIVTHNNVLKNDLLNSAAKINADIIVVSSGSNRESQEVEQANAIGKENGSSLPRLKEFHARISEEAKKQNKKNLEVKFDDYLITDSFTNEPAGTTFKRMEADLKDEKKPDYIKPYIEQGFQHADFSFDHSKILNIYAKVHRLASENSDADIVCDLNDDSMGILNDLTKFYSKHSDLLPNNVTLRLKHYDGTQEEIDTVAMIQGTGKIDHNYGENILKLVKHSQKKDLLAELNIETEQQIFEKPTELQIFPDHWNVIFDAKAFLQERNTDKKDESAVREYAYTLELNALEHLELKSTAGICRAVKDKKMDEQEIVLITHLLRSVRNIIKKPLGKDFDNLRITEYPLFIQNELSQFKDKMSVFRQIALNKNRLKELMDGKRKHDFPEINARLYRAMNSVLISSRSEDSWDNQETPLLQDFARQLEADINDVNLEKSLQELNDTLSHKPMDVSDVKQTAPETTALQAKAKQLYETIVEEKENLRAKDLPLITQLVKQTTKNLQEPAMVSNTEAYRDVISELNRTPLGKKRSTKNKIVGAATAFFGGLVMLAGAAVIAASIAACVASWGLLSPLTPFGVVGGKALLLEGAAIIGVAIGSVMINEGINTADRKVGIAKSAYSFLELLPKTKTSNVKDEKQTKKPALECKSRPIR
jgi:hypothetical protein